MSSERPSSRYEEGTSSRLRAEERAKRAIKASIIATKAQIDKSISRRDEHITSFNRLRKCLEILLDTKLIDMVLADSADSAIVRKVANDYAHANSNPNICHETLGRLQEISETVQMDMSEMVRGSVDRLSEILYFSNDYFDKKVTTVKESVDRFIRTNAGKPGERVTDFHILLNRLDTADWSHY